MELSKGDIIKIGGTVFWVEENNIPEMKYLCYDRQQNHVYISYEVVEDVALVFRKEEKTCT